MFDFVHLSLLLKRSTLTHTKRHETPVLDHPIKIIHLDDDLIVLDKPCSVPVSSCSIHIAAIAFYLEMKEMYKSFEFSVDDSSRARKNASSFSVLTKLLRFMWKIHGSIGGARITNRIVYDVLVLITFGIGSGLSHNKPHANYVM